MPSLSPHVINNFKASTLGSMYILKYFKDEKFMMRVIFCLIISSMIFSQSSVYWEPEIPVPGGEITIYYNVIEGDLNNSTNPVYIHIGYDGWEDVDDYAMTFEPSLGSGWWSYTYSIPEDSQTIDFVFTDLNDNWDNNGGIGIDWHISLNYYWTPFNPDANDVLDIILNNVNVGGSIVWTVDDGSGFNVPLNSYCPAGTSDISDLPWELNYVGNWVSSPLIENSTDNSYHALLGPFDQGEQIVQSIKYVIRWEDGTWDVGSNGQIIFYDIYFDYSGGVFFQSPSNGAIVDPPVTFTALGSADLVEYWIDGSMIGSDSSIPFQVTWDPIDGLFGNYTIAARAVNSSGNVTFTFIDIELDYEINEQPLPTQADDGLNINSNNVVITLYAPNKEYVALKGSWNTEYPYGQLMNYDDTGFWWYETNLSQGEYTYQFNVDGLKYIADPWSKDVIWRQPGGVQESGYYGDALTVFQVGSDDYVWGDTDFVRPNQNEVVIYELFIGDFLSDGENNHGTFNDVTEKIQSGYFSDLGINAIELMPVNEFEGSYSWGYNPTFYMAPESSYGTVNELKLMIDVAHQNNIAVLMDVVFDHLWGSSPLFQLYQPPNNYEWSDHDYNNCPYFDDIGEEWEWGYKLNHWKERTRKHIDDIIYHWINEYHIDGFRFDYTNGIGWDPSSQFGANHYANMLTDQSLILIAEEDNAYQINNSNFDAGWDYTYHHMMLANLGSFNHDGHVYGDMDDLASHIDAYSQGYNEHTGQLIYTESHDEERIVYECTEFQNYSIEEGYNISKLGMAVLMTSEGTPMIYQGQEFGQSSITSHLEPQPLQWNNLNTELGSDLFDSYSKMIDLRKNRIALKENNLVVKYKNSDQKIISYWRISDQDEFVIIANFDDYSHNLDLEFPHPGEWFNVLEGNSINIESNFFGNYQIPAKTAHVFTSSLDQSEECNLGDLNSDLNYNVLDVVMLANCVLQGSCSGCAGDMNQDGNYNVLDVVTLANCVLQGNCGN